MDPAAEEGRETPEPGPQELGRTTDRTGDLLDDLAHEQAARHHHDGGLAINRALPEGLNDLLAQVFGVGVRAAHGAAWTVRAAKRSDPPPAWIVGLPVAQHQ